MPNIWFLSASVPLTKRYTLLKKVIEKHPYPHVADFTSACTNIPDIKTFYSVLCAKAKTGACLIKGKLSRELANESRAGSTTTTDTTQWICLDLDQAPFASHEEFITEYPVLKDVSYIVQHSASHGLPGAVGLSCHIFMLLDKPVQAPALKAWLMDINLKDGPIRRALKLTQSAAYLHWPLDITACQNDKLLYITPPIVDDGIKYKNTPIQLVPGKLPTLPTARVSPGHIEKMKLEQRVLIDAKRDELGLPKLRAKLRTIKEFEIQPLPGVMLISETKIERGFRYFNINGGDSWGYYQPENDIELVHNFKGEPSYLTKEIAPDWYREQILKRRLNTDRPYEDGRITKVFCERKSAKYYKMVWNPVEMDLQLFPAKSELQLEHFLNEYGQSLHGEFIEQWDLYFNPQDNTIVDLDNKKVNLYAPSSYYKTYTPVKNNHVPPICERIIQSAVSNNEKNATYEHFLNWLACICQYRCKTRTAWVFSGTYGTGKNLIISKILAPLFGRKYVVEKRNRELEEQWTGWLETAIIAYVDEVQVSSSKNKEQISQDLKNMITEPYLSMRRMNVDPYLAESFCNFIFSTNKLDPVVMDDADRRFNFGDFQKTALKVTTEEIELQLPEELPLFFNYLMTRKADRALAATILKNDARESVIKANQTSIDMLVEAIGKGDLEFLWESMPDITLQAELHGAHSVYAVAYAKILAQEGKELVRAGKNVGHDTRKYESRLTRDQLQVIFEFCIGGMPVSPNKFSRMLKHHGIETSRLRVADRSVHGMHVTWTVSTKWCEDHKDELGTKPPHLRSV